MGTSAATGFLIIFGALAAASVTLRRRVITRPKESADLVLPSPEMQSALSQLKTTFGQRAPQALAAVKAHLVTLHRQAAVAILYTAEPKDASVLYEDMQHVAAELLSAASDLDTAARDARDLAIAHSVVDVIERRSRMLLRAVRNKYNIRSTGFPAPSSGTPFFSSYPTNGPQIEVVT
jgi:hypothetical protein